MIGPIYNAPVICGELAVAVTKNNEVIVANATDLEVSSVVRITNKKQLWVEVWNDAPVIRNAHEVYKLPQSSEELAPLWKESDGDVLLMPDNKVIAVKPTSWRNPVLDICCFDKTGNKLLWSIKDDRYSSVNNYSGLLLAKGKEANTQALINMMDGSVEWEFQSPVSGGELRPCFADDSRVYFYSVQSGISECELCKVERNSGELSWAITIPEIGCKYDRIRNQFVCFSSGKLTLIDANSGEIIVDRKEAVELIQASRQLAFKVALDAQAGKLVFDESSETPVIGVYDYVNNKLLWQSTFCEDGNVHVGKLWFNDRTIHIFDSMSMLRVGRDEGDHLVMI